MPEYNDPVARDAIRELRGELRRTQREVTALRSMTGKVALDRGSQDDIPSPQEGQVMVNHVTDKPYHYAREEWHPFSGESRRPWVVLEGTGWDVANNTQSALVVDTLYWDPTLTTLDAGDPTNDIGGIFVIGTATDTLNGQDYWTVLNRDEGWFTFELAVAFDEASSRQVAVTGTFATAQVFPTASGGGGFSLDRVAPMRVGGDWRTTVETSLTAWAETPGLLHLYRTIWCPAQRDWNFLVKHTGGATISAAGHLKIWHEEDAFGGDPDNNNWEAASL